MAFAVVLANRRSPLILSCVWPMPSAQRFEAHVARVEEEEEAKERAAQEVERLRLEKIAQDKAKEAERIAIFEKATAEAFARKLEKERQVSLPAVCVFASLLLCVFASLLLCFFFLFSFFLAQQQRNVAVSQTRRRMKRSIRPASS